MAEPASSIVSSLLSSPLSSHTPITSTMTVIYSTVTITHSPVTTGHADTANNVAAWAAWPTFRPPTTLVYIAKTHRETSPPAPLQAREDPGQVVNSDSAVLIHGTRTAPTAAAYATLLPEQEADDLGTSASDLSLDLINSICIRRRDTASANWFCWSVAPESLPDGAIAAASPPARRQLTSRTRFRAAAAAAGVRAVDPTTAAGPGPEEALDLSSAATSLSDLRKAMCIRRRDTASANWFCWSAAPESLPDGAIPAVPAGDKSRRSVDDDDDDGSAAAPSAPELMNAICIRRREAANLFCPDAVE